MITVMAWQPLAAKMVKEFEGCKLKAYLCPAGIATIGWGTTGPDVRLGMVWTQEQADERLLDDLSDFGDAVAKLVKTAPTTAHQWGALVSFAYNVGSDALRRSTLLRKHLEGDYAGAQAEFARWNKAGGKTLRGLTRRRKAEADMYGTPDE